MPNSTRSRKSAAGCGTIRKKVIRRGDKEYVYWEARYSNGFDPGTGKQIQKSISGKTQREVAQKLKLATSSIDQGTYIEPSKITVAEWLEIWQEEYLCNIKPSTRSSYKATIKNHISPRIGALRLESLTTHQIQSFYNSLLDPEIHPYSLSAKTIKNIHGVLHRSLQQAMFNGYLRSNPSDPCVLPQVIKKKIKPLNDYQIAEFMKAVKGHRYEKMFLTALFTGVRQGELCGLQWECIDFLNGTILIDKQLQSIRSSIRGANDKYVLIPTKNSKERLITAAPFVMDLLWQVKQDQDRNRRLFGEAFIENGLVFTDEIGRRITPQALYRAFKIVVDELGLPNTRFHDLRHSYAVASIRAGDDIKTVQENLGHATAAFTLDVYGHVTDQMKQDSANRMQRFIQNVAG
ncbi:MAG: site-specific integrase [Oscillospiraceae bacterium]|nr:site-specific integrase [Oscillospiraceae bacterium]